ncbi:MAG: tetratricopeptide repeat protein [Planctomycetota bacterium]
MKNLQRTVRFAHPCVTIAALFSVMPLVGCGPNYRELRHQGQTLMLDGAIGSACVFFKQAEERKPRDVQNLHDLGTCSLLLAKGRFQQMNHAAAMREVDAAIAYFSAAIDAHPSHQASLEGKNIALELKGQFDEALKHAEWAAEFVGPAARQYVFLARELEERGDRDGALLRYRQAVAMEPRNAEAHRAFARFLLRNQNESAAVAHLQAAYQLDPSDKWALEQLVAHGTVPTLSSKQQRTP